MSERDREGGEAKTAELIYGIDDVPPLGEGLLLGLQHYLTMFGSTVAIPLILSEPLGIEQGSHDQAMLIATMFFVSGITTLLQVTLGNRLPIVQGGTFSFLAPTFAICGMAGVKEATDWHFRMQHVQGAIITGSLFEIAVGASGLVGLVRRYVGPITIAPTIALIGLALFKFGAPLAGEDWKLGGATIVFIILFSQYLRNAGRAFTLFPILLGILCAWVLAIVGTYGEAWGILSAHFGPNHPSHVSFEAVKESPWFRVPYPFQWGMPQFTVAAFVGMLAGYVASIIESIGDYYACARLSGAPVPDEKTINRGILYEGIGCFVAGVIGTGNGTTSYSENIGAIGLTRVGSRRVIVYGALCMLVFGAVAKFGAVFASIPKPIVGGMYCALFGMIAAVGISNLQFVDLNSARNLFIVGFSFFMGLSVPEYFNAHPIAYGGDSHFLKGLVDVVNTIGTTGMAVGGFLAFVLDNTVPGTPEERGLTAWIKQG